MARHYVSNTNSPIIYYCNKCKFSKADLCRHLNIGIITLNKWIEQPKYINIEYLLLMSGLFGISVEEFVYLLIRNKPKLKKEHIEYLKRFNEV